MKSRRFRMMGILNVTPDSFSDGGEFHATADAVERALVMVREGADIIDIGGESTRPPGAAYGEGAQSVTEAEELARVLPVIEGIRAADEDILLSIDTQKSGVAERALLAGANIINDVSAGTSDVRMFEAAAAHQAPIILMHGHGPRFDGSAIEAFHYANVVEEVFAYLRERIDAARKAGVSEIWADVGIGFAKGYRDNLTLLRRHERFAALGVPMVIGVSRKSTIGKAMGTQATSGLPSTAVTIAPSKDRLSGSIAAACYGFEHGAETVRTHDVKATREALEVVRAILIEGDRN